MVLGNPHFPWDGSERFFESQLTIPGKVNVSGASLFGVPIVLIGHTDHLAWSHTVSTAYRFTPFELKLVPGSPTTYLYDGQPRQMRADEVTVTVKNADGSLATRSRTLYSSHHGLDPDVDPRTAAVPLDAGDRVGDGRRERRQLPLPEPLLRDQPWPRARLSCARSRSATRACRG